MKSQVSLLQMGKLAVGKRKESQDETLWRLSSIVVERQKQTCQEDLITQKGKEWNVSS